MGKPISAYKSIGYFYLKGGALLWYLLNEVAANLANTCDEQELTEYIFQTAFPQLAISIYYLANPTFPLSESYSVTHKKEGAPVADSTGSRNVRIA